MPKVVFFTTLAEQSARDLTSHAPANYEVGIYPTGMADEEKAALVEDADFLILFPSYIADSVLQQSTKLKLIQLVSAGFDRMNMELCHSLGIPVANNGGANSIDVAEHTITLILAFYRRLIEMDSNVRNDKWKAIDSGVSTYTIHGKTVGLVGLGNIGRQTARRLRAFGANLLYADAFPAPDAVEEELSIQRVELEELLQRSDIVSLHVPLNDDTQGMIGAEQLGLMKPTALLVNTCRGPVVDEAALIDALQDERIRGAALDVLEKEPPDPDNPLFDLDNVLLTPHTAGVTYDTWSRRGEFIFENLQRVWNGDPAMALVSNP